MESTTTVDNLSYRFMNEIFSLVLVWLLVCAELCAEIAIDPISYEYTPAMLRGSGETCVFCG